MIASAAIHESGLSESYGMVGRYGLPNKADLAWIRKVIGKQPLLFLGDMDPVDLMVFVWLRASRVRNRLYISVSTTTFSRQSGFPKSVRCPFHVRRRSESLLRIEKAAP